MKNRYLLILFISIIMVLIVISSLLFINNDSLEKSQINKVCFKETCFQVEIADTPQLRQKGLMYRTQLDSDKGMLFIFDEEGIYPFWMKNTLIPLDIIWIDENKEIVYIENEAQPCKEEICKSYNPQTEAKYILEINARLSEELAIKVGDKADFNF